jgi:hypothetical protein
MVRGDLLIGVRNVSLKVYRENPLAPASESRYPPSPLFFAKYSKIMTYI